MPKTKKIREDNPSRPDVLLGYVLQMRRHAT